jgi:hypothetical protein
MELEYQWLEEAAGAEESDVTSDSGDSGCAVRRPHRFETRVVGLSATVENGVRCTVAKTKGDGACALHSLWGIATRVSKR